MKYVAAFVAGCLCGAAIMVPVIGGRLETVLLERQRLMLTLVDYRSRLERLGQQLATHQAPRVVESVEVILRGVDNQAHALAVKRLLQPYTHELVGKEVSALDPHLVISVFDQRPLSLNGAAYVMTVEALVVDRKVIIFLRGIRVQDDRDARIPTGSRS